MSFEQLCRVFVRGLLEKSHAWRYGKLSDYQRSRLADAITTDIRKLGDMVFPAARLPRVSAAAKELADLHGVDLSTLTWHAQKKVDGYKTFTYEHFFPVLEVRKALSSAADVDEAMGVLNQMLWVAWITKQEDARLHQLGYGSKRPDPYKAYSEAGIELIPVDTEPAHMSCKRDCSRCGQRAATWIVTGGEHSNAPGRVLLYCDTCRHEMATDFGVALQLVVFYQAPETILASLYGSGVIQTDPRFVVALLGIAERGWGAGARREG